MAGSVSAGSVSGLLNRGHAADSAGRTAQAQRVYRRVLVDDPDNAVAHHRLAIIADRQHDFDSADYHYHRALRVDRKNPDLLSDLGYSYLLQERYQESEDFLREGVRLSPGHRRAWSNLGLLFAVQGDYDRSLAAFRRSGSEREAQARLAALFPNGRPRSGPVQRQPAPPRDSVRAPQPVPTRVSRRATGRIEPSAERYSVPAPGQQSVRRGSESLTRQLQDAMQTARQQRRSDKRSLRSPGRVAAAARPRLAPRRTTSIPGNRINRTFSDIDRDGRLAGQSRPTAVYSMNHRRQSTGPSPSLPVTDAQQNPAWPTAPALSGRLNSSAPTGSDPSLLWPPHGSDTDSSAPPGRLRQAVRQTDYSSRSRQNQPATRWTDETRRAARIGLAAGPGAVMPTSPVTQSPTTVPLGSSSSATRFSVSRFSDTNRRAAGSSYQNKTAPLPQHRLSGNSPRSTTPRRLPRALAERVPASRQVFVPAPNQPTGYQMRSESARRIDPSPYQPSQGQVTTDSRPRSATVPNQPPSYGYQPEPYQSQRRSVPTRRATQTGLNRDVRSLDSPRSYRPQPYRPQSYRPQSGEASRLDTGRIDRPRIMPSGSGSRLPTQQGERSFAVPPSNARSVIIPQQFLPR